MEVVVLENVSNLYLQNKIHITKGLFNILDCGVRTGKTYWAAHYLVDYTRDGKLNRILILTDTTALKDQIIESYSDMCANADEFWNPGVSWGENADKIGIMCYQRFGYMLMHNGLEMLSELDVICWDECDSIFNFASSAFTKARKTDYARAEKSNSEILSAIQEYSTKGEYMPLILLGFWEKIIQHEDIYCIGLSATPERAIQYYNVLTSASYKGKIDAGFRAKEDIYFTNINEHVKTLDPNAGICYWCYSPYIEPNKGIVLTANRQGFIAIEIHSPNNTDKPMDSEQMRVLDSIIHTGTVPPPYNFVVVNAALRSGITITDERFNHLIVNSFKSDDKIQAARMTFPYQRHQRVWLPQIPEEYRDTWLTVVQCRQLAEELEVLDLDKGNKNSTRILTWNGLKEVLPLAGYTVESARKRLNGKQSQCYKISGEWHDIDAADKEFEKLLAARVGS